LDPLSGREGGDTLSLLTGGGKQLLELGVSSDEVRAAVAMQRAAHLSPSDEST